MTQASVTDRRLDRVVLVQAHCSALGLAAVLSLGVAADRLADVPGSWQVWRNMLFTAAGLSLAGAGLPWLAAAFTVSWQRWLLGGAALFAAIGVSGAAWAVDLLAVLGIQLLVSATALAELGGQRHALRWFWVVAGVLVAAVGGYHFLVDVQPRPE